MKYFTISHSDSCNIISTVLSIYPTGVGGGGGGGGGEVGVRTTAQIFSEVVGSPYNQFYTSELPALVQTTAVKISRIE